MNFGDKLHEFLVNKKSTLSQEDRNICHLHFKDWLGCLIAGSYSTNSRKLAALLEQNARQDSPFNNPFFLGYASHVLEFDDSEFYGETHPSSVIFSSLFHESNDLYTMEEIFSAAIIGYYSLVPLGHGHQAAHHAQPGDHHRSSQHQLWDRDCGEELLGSCAVGFIEPRTSGVRASLPLPVESAPVRRGRLPGHRATSHRSFA